jgi:glycosyltransferase involved in cell wall biosynthesis
LKICQLTNVGFALKKFLLPLIDAQISNGDEVVAVCSKDEYVSDLIKAGYNLKTIPINRGMNPLKHLYSIWLIFKFFQKEKFDIVHVHTPVAALVGRIAARLSGVPVVIYTAHGFYFHDDMRPGKRLFFICLERFAGLMTTMLFTQSSEDAKTAVNEKIMKQEKVFEIGNGVDIKRFNPEIDLSTNRIKTELGISENFYVVGMIGRQVKEKGIIELLESAMTLIEKYEDICFIIVGERLDSDHAEGVEIAINNFRALTKERLIMTGMRSDIPQLLQAMDLFTLPSWREGMPRTIIEAMMMELPVVATDIRGSREEVVNGETGILVPVRNPKALTEAIELLYRDRKKTKEMGAAGRKKALKQYNEQKIIEKQLMIINSIN